MTATRRTRLISRTTLAAGAAIALIALSGCSSSEPDAASSDASGGSAAAPDKAQAAGRSVAQESALDQAAADTALAAFVLRASLALGRGFGSRDRRGTVSIGRARCRPCSISPCGFCHRSF